MMSLLGAAQSALDPAGPQAGRVSSLWWLFFYTTGAIYLLVILAMFAAVLHTKRQKPPTERRLRAVVGSAVGVTIVVLFTFLICEFLTGRKLYALASEPQQLEIKVVGHQWWWETEYRDKVPSQIVTGANEIHIPVGVTVKFDLESNDVIHSFWVPSLSGKKDLIPGHPTHIWLRADYAGTFQGQCAEFCGQQHAHMRLLIVAEDRSTFDTWLASQRKPAPDPQTDLQKRGQAVFLGATCMLCHTIDGTIARGHVGPNLTHIASSSTIGAGTLPNTSETRMNWIQNPHQFKPGVIMPQHNLSVADLTALNDYLESLK